jgi:hypothetical protein
MTTPTYPTSGTTSFNLDVTQIVEDAYERCGSELRSGYDLRTARRSLGLMFLDWANRGYNLWTVDGPYTITLIQGQATYNLPADTVDLIDHVIRTGAGSAFSQQDLNITRIALPTYLSIPNKLSQGRPIQVWIDRLGSQNDSATTGATGYVTGTQYPTITVWPIPDGSQTWQFVYYRIRRIQDPGNGVEGQDIPFRFLPVAIAGLAYYLSMKIPNALPRMQMLKAVYDEQWENAATEDREKASVRFVPRQSFMR